MGFGGENEVVEEVFGLRNKVYILSRCYFIILNIKFIIWCKLLEISNNYVITISYIYIYIYDDDDDAKKINRLNGLGFNGLVVAWKA